MLWILFKQQLLPDWYFQLGSKCPVHPSGIITVMKEVIDQNQPVNGATCIACGYGYPDPDTAGSQPPEMHQPCPHCGAKGIDFQVQLSDTVEVREMIGLKSKRQGDKKPFIETKTGDDLHRKSGRWMKLERHIDRENDHYHEKVTNPETGEVIHENDEPLSEHQGHGSAKPKDS